MNKQGKNGIEWCDYTWSPVTGCLHGCEYCYARRMANRFSMKFTPLIGEFDGRLYELKDDIMMDLNSPVVENGHIQPYPAGFAPTFHKYRLDEPAKIKQPSKIFVVSMGDLFGDWVPDEWIQEVFKACEAAPWHKYLFLTKNPKRYAQEDLIRSCLVNQDYYSCSYFGVSVTNQQMMDEAMDRFSKINIACPKFISIEPLLNDIQIKDIWKLKWVIIGQQTGPGAVPPKDEWVQNIIDQCRAADVPVFVKSPLYEKFPIQEWPEGLRV